MRYSGNSGCDEHAVCAEERAWSWGERADRKPVERANRVLVATANRCSTSQRVFFPAALAFFHLALAAAGNHFARPSALILRRFLVELATTRVPFILAPPCARPPAIHPRSACRRHPATLASQQVRASLSPQEMDASCVSSCSICSLMATAARSCATLKLLRGVIKGVGRKAELRPGLGQ